jgi:hypothetical protein
MDYVSFMRRVDGKPPKVEPEVDTSGFYYTNSSPPNLGPMRGVLSGDVSTLSSSFTWSETPQGYTHWSRINNGFAQLTAWDTQYLEWLLEEYS